MRETILTSLREIEEEFGVKILYACESGSRSWQLHSERSDYDVRFIYVHKKVAYLTIDPVGIGKKRDVIELPIDDLLDVSGWELTKALRLFRKSNPPLMEWLHSKIIYFQAYSTIEKMKDLSKMVFAPDSCLHHYLNMATHNERIYIQGEQVEIKDYLKVLRPLLAAKWIETFNQFPPLEFPTLLNRLVPEGVIKHEINLLLKGKLNGADQAVKPKAVLNQFITSETTRLREFTKTLTHDLPDPTPLLDDLFRTTLEEIELSNAQN